MAYTYGYFFPVEADDDFYADQLNFLRESMDRHADQVGATITLPASMVDDTPIIDSDTLFQDWLDAARTAIEVLLEDYLYWDNTAKEFVAWTKADLLGYIHATWSTACTPSDIADTEEWYPYSTASLNEYWIVYINEVYYALECLCYHLVATEEYTTPTRTTKHGDGADGEDGGDVLGGALVTVASATQSGNFGKAVQASAVGVYYGDMSMSIWVTDNGSGGWNVEGSVGCTLVGGGINYATGAWSVVTDNAFSAGIDGASYALSAGVAGSPSVALAAAWTAFNAASFAGTGASWQAIAHLHAYASGNIRIAYIDSYKVTDAQVVIPALTWDLAAIYLEAMRTYFPYSPSPSISKGTGVGEVEVSTYRYHSWLKVEEALNDENLTLAYYFDINSTNFNGTEDIDAAAPYEVSPEDGVGLCGFGGYLNGEYAPI